MRQAGRGMLAAAVVVAGVVAVALGAAGPTMNGFPYSIANNPPGHASPAFRGEFFEFMGLPIDYRYSEVHWQQAKVPLPADIVSRFDNKVMVITGYEVDVMRKNSSGGLEPAPCYHHYNHHYTNWIHGKGATMVDNSGNPDAPNDPHSVDRKLPGWRIDPAVQRLTDALPGEVAHVHVLSEGNGNEHRGSFKAYPSKFGQLLFSPTYLIEAPMMINTNKELTSAAGTPGPTAGAPVPKASLAPTGANYSGILECPCTTRTTKTLGAYGVQLAACSSAEAVASAAECEHAAAVNGLANASFHNKSDPTLPPGCSATFHAASATWAVAFNPAAESQAACRPPSGRPHAVGGMQSLVALELDLDASSGVATITLSGPADVWFGVGFNASLMADQPYAITVEGGTGNVTERKLAMHAAGSPLAPSVRVVSSSVAAARRTVVLERPLVGATAAHFTFSPSAVEQPMINAVGGSAQYSYHKARTGAVLLLAQAGDPLCVCRDANVNTGSINGVTWRNPCAPFPIGDLIKKDNAICSVAAYNGGLYCCHNKVILLDADQEVPPQSEEIFFKYRFYFEDYTPGASFNLYRTWWSTEAFNNEYDVPQSTADCSDPSTPSSECEYVIHSIFKGVDFITAGCMNTPPCMDPQRVQAQDNGEFVLLYAALHCHAPGCLYAELRDLDTGELICRNNATYGSGALAHNEADYVVAIPPCVWGPQDGLYKPPVIRLDGNYSTTKYVNNTVGHYGVMGLWQNRAAYLSDYKQAVPQANPSTL